MVQMSGSKVCTQLNVFTCLNTNDHRVEQEIDISILLVNSDILIPKATIVQQLCCLVCFLVLWMELYSMYSFVPRFFFSQQDSEIHQLV